MCFFKRTTQIAVSLQMLNIRPEFNKPSTDFEPTHSLTTQKLMEDTYSLVHIRSCDIHPNQLQFQEQIGEGKFGLVYKGVWKGRACAIKKLKNGISKDSVEYQRLLIELGILAGVGDHSNIVGFLGACILDIGSPMIVEELVDGTNLANFLSGKSIGFNLGRAKVTSAYSYFNELASWF